MKAKQRRLISMLCIGSLATGLLVVGTEGAIAEGNVGVAQSNSAFMVLAAAEKPLDEIANALGDQGRGEFADTYSNLRVDSTHNRIFLYATDLQRAAEMVQAAEKARPGIDTSRIEVIKAAYAKKAIDVQLERIIRSPEVKNSADLTVYTAAAAPDGSGIEVTARPDALKQAHALAAASSGGIPVTVTAGTPVTPAEWRWNDDTPFIGGDMLVGPSRIPGYVAQCTSGLAAEDINGNDYLLTSAHCYGTGVTVYGNGNPVGDLSSLRYGHRIGTVVSESTEPWDAALINTGGSNGQGTNSDEADTPYGRWIPVDSEAYSYIGQSVCQDGTRSYYTGHGVPCGIAVSNSDIWVNIKYDNGAMMSIRGVQGISTGWAVTNGDSGGLVFSINGANTRQGRGLVAAESGNSTMFWTEAPDILDYFGVHLNPHQ